MYKIANGQDLLDRDWISELNLLLQPSGWNERPPFEKHTQHLACDARPDGEFFYLAKGEDQRKN
nr:hypothetical protein [Candidatus Sigynarchaeota archaeon]